MPRLPFSYFIKSAFLCFLVLFLVQTIEGSIFPEESSQAFLPKPLDQGLTTQQVKTDAGNSSISVNLGTQSKQAAGQRSLTRGKVAIKAPIRKHPPLGCEQFTWPNGTRSIAIIGNGPLSKAHRLAIEVRWKLMLLLLLHIFSTAKMELLYAIGFDHLDIVRSTGACNA